MIRGWLPLYRLSLALGARNAARRGGAWRETAIRLLVPIEVDRYLEFSETERALAARAGERVLDLASPKLLAVHLAARGVEVTCVDQFPDEIETWRTIAGHRPGVRFEVGDGRALEYPDASFDHAYSVSVLEHIPEPGDEQALAELARVVKPGGRVVLTLPHAREYSEDWRDRPVYLDQGGATERHFFARWYDDARLDRLVAAAPGLELVERRFFDWKPSRAVDWYRRNLQRSAVASPAMPFFLTPRENPGGGIACVTLRRR